MKKILALILSVALSAAVFAQNVSNGPVTKKTSGANANDLNEDLNVNTGRTVNVKGGTLSRTGSGVVSLNATLAALSVTNGANLDALSAVSAASYVLTSGSYADPAWITSLAATKLTGTVPTARLYTTAAGYNITGGAQLDAVASLASTGLVTRTAANTIAARTITGTAGQISVANGDGVAGNPTISLPSTITQATIFQQNLTITKTGAGVDAQFIMNGSGTNGGANIVLNSATGGGTYDYISYQFAGSEKWLVGMHDSFSTGGFVVRDSVNAYTPLIMTAGAVSAATFKVQPTTPSSSTSTGALVVGNGTSGGLGVGGQGTFGSISSPGSGTNSERFGSGASTSTVGGALAVGKSASVTTADDGTALGNAASATGGRGFAGGSSASSTGQYGVAIGWQAASSGGMRIGPQGTAASDSIAIGGFAISTTTGQIKLTTTNADSEVWLGAGPSTAAGYYTRINGSSPSSAGTGGILYLAGGKGGDAASTGGAVKIQTASAGAGTTLVDRLTIAADGTASFGSSVTVNSPAAASAGVVVNSFNVASGTAQYWQEYKTPAGASTFGRFLRGNGAAGYIDSLNLDTYAGFQIKLNALGGSSGTFSVLGGDASFAGSITSTSATSGIGYATGAGGTVTQATSRTTGVTLNKITGDITLVSAAGTTSWQSFTVTNSAVAATDNVKVDQKSGTDKYQIHVTAVAAGSFVITYATTAGTTTEQPVFHFSVIKSVNS